MATVFLLMDAFRHDYLSEENTPFLWECAESGELYEGVEQSFGFCERSEIVSGLKADETGFFSAVGFDPENSPYTNFRALNLFEVGENVALKLIKLLLPEKFGSRVHKRLRLIVTRYFQWHGVEMPNFQIPYSWLKYFALTEDRVDLREHGLFKKPSIFELMDKRGQSYLYETFTALGLRAKYTTDQSRLDAVLESANNDPKDMYLVYLASPDVAGHFYGPTNPSVTDSMGDLDNQVATFVRELESISSGNEYIFLGDHGMLTVERHFDAKSELNLLFKLNGLKVGSDVIYFLDSTMVRVWSMNEAAAKALPAILQQSETFDSEGAWVTEEMASELRIPWPDRRYGDFLWIATSGTLVFPDFFRKVEPAKGMHGYRPELEDSLGVCIYWGSGIAKSRSKLMPLAGVYDLLKRSQGL